MKTIYLIDDSPDRHLQLQPLIESLNASAGAVPDYAATYPSNGVEANDVARQSIDVNGVWSTVCQAEPNSIFLIDLLLDGVNEITSTKSLTQLITDTAEPWGVDARQWMIAAQEEYPGLLSTYSTALLACAVLKARKISFILVSTAAAADTFTSWCETWGIPSAQSRARDQWKSWKDEIIKLHRHADPITRQILDLYAGPIAGDDSSWDHDWCEHNIQLGSNIWGFVLDDPQNKALHLRGDEWRLSDDPSRRVAGSVLRDVVKKLGFGCFVQCNCDWFVFPREPGIVFLLSLRGLIAGLVNDKKPKPKAVLFGKESNLYFVSVELQDANQCETIDRILIRQWKQHRTFYGPDSICEPIPDGGFSEAIFHFCHSRLGGILGDEDWVKLFRNGSRRWVAWPCLTDKGIAFYWRG
jgi:hypothetical protein